VPARCLDDPGPGQAVEGLRQVKAVVGVLVAGAEQLRQDDKLSAPSSRLLDQSGRMGEVILDLAHPGIHLDGGNRQVGHVRDL